VEDLLPSGLIRVDWGDSVSDVSPEDLQPVRPQGGTDRSSPMLGGDAAQVWEGSKWVSGMVLHIWPDTRVRTLLFNDGSRLTNCIADLPFWHVQPTGRRMCIEEF